MTGYRCSRRAKGASGLCSTNSSRRDCQSRSYCRHNCRAASQRANTPLVLHTEWRGGSSVQVVLSTRREPSSCGDADKRAARGGGSYEVQQWMTCRKFEIPALLAAPWR